MGKTTPKAKAKSNTVKKHSVFQAGGGKEPINVFAAVDLALCESCEQTTHDIERDSGEPGHFLLWTKTCWSRTSKSKKTIGNECYRCYDVRRRFFHSVWTTGVA